MNILIDKNRNFYKANLHCHTTLSDGRLTREEVKARYKAEGYSIIAYTDHEHLIDNSDLNDDSFLTITSAELAIKENRIPYFFHHIAQWLLINLLAPFCN